MKSNYMTVIASSAKMLKKRNKNRIPAVGEKVSSPFSRSRFPWHTIRALKVASSDHDASFFRFLVSTSEDGSTCAPGGTLRSSTVTHVPLSSIAAYSL